MKKVRFGIVAVALSFIGFNQAFAGLNCFERVQSSAENFGERSISDVPLIRRSVLDVTNNVSKLRQEKFTHGQWVTIIETQVVFTMNPSLESMDADATSENDNANPMKIFTTYEASYRPEGEIEGSTHLKLGVSFSRLEKNGTFSAILQTKSPMLPLQLSNFYCLRIAKPF